MDTDWVGQRIEVVYRKGLFWDHFVLQFLLITQMKRYFVKFLSLLMAQNTLYDILTIQRTLDKLIAREKKVWYEFQCKQVWSNAYRENKFGVSILDE